jgi:hypothetical protein
VRWVVGRYHTARSIAGSFVSFAGARLARNKLTNNKLPVGVKGFKSWGNHDFTPSFSNIRRISGFPRLASFAIVRIAW